jgi:hypothetical protein
MFFHFVMDKRRSGGLNYDPFLNGERKHESSQFSATHM